MRDRVIRGSLHVEGRDLGEVVARIADEDGPLAGLLILTAADGLEAFPEHLWIPAWLSPVGRGPAVAIKVRRSASGGLDFRTR